MNVIKNNDLNSYFDDMEEKNNELVNSDDIDRKNRFILPSKQFKSRRSLIVALVEDNIHFKSFYNFVAGLTCFIMFSLNFNEYQRHSRMSPAIYLIYKAFGKLELVCLIWLGNNIFTFLCYYVFIVWAKIRKTGWLYDWIFAGCIGIGIVTCPGVVFLVIEISAATCLAPCVPLLSSYSCSISCTSGFNKIILDQFCLMLLIIYYGFSFIVMTFLIFYLKIPFASSLILSLDSIRFLMKVHAFIRSNVPKVLNKSNKKNINLPTLFQYVEFLYIPTTVYKDEYPRSNKIRWNFVVHRFIEILWCIACMAHLYIYTVKPIFKDICFNSITILDFFILCLECGVPSLFMTWLFIFSAIHSAQNGVGEIIKFGDRMFYLDWWNLKDGRQFFRKWNWVVGDFLKFYVYKDLFEIIYPGNRVLAKLLTFIISAIVHEWIFITATGFFCPITTVLMIFSAFLLDFHIYNINFTIVNYYSFFLGSGIMGTFFCVEIFARQNLPLKNNELFVFWNNCFV